MKERLAGLLNAVTFERHLLVFALLVFTTSGSASDFILVRGQECLVVIPQKPSLTEEFAAKELCRYLTEITKSKNFSINREDGGATPAKCIYIGHTDCGAEAAKQILGKDQESFVISVQDNRVVLNGNSDRASLYAVFSFLEQLGCLWLAPGIEQIPHKGQIALRGGCQIHSPGIKYRVLRCIKTSTTSGFGTQCMDWAVKNRVNIITDQDMKTQFPYEVRKRGSARGVNSTHMSGYILTKDLYDRQPEVFARDMTGKAVLNAHSQQFCFSARQAVSVYADTLGRYINSHPEVELFPITQADGTRYCQCADCLKLYGKMTLYDESSAISGQPNVTKAWMTFVNKVAERIGRAWPDKRFYTLAYSSASDPTGMDFAVNKSVLVVYVHSVSMFDQLHTYGRGLAKHSFLDLYKKWRSSVPGGVGVYDYYPFSKFRSLPLVAIEKVSTDVKTVHGLDCPYFELQSGTSFGMYLPVYYAAARMMWNPGIDLGEEMRLFYKGMYGSAAAYAERFFQTLEKARETYLHPYKHDTRTTDLADVLSYMTKEVVDEAETLIEKARTSAAPSMETRERLQPIVDHFNYAKHLRRGRDAYSLYNTTRDVRCLEEAVQHADEIASLVEEVGHSKEMRHTLGIIRPTILQRGRSGVGDEIGSWKSALNKEPRNNR